MSDTELSRLMAEVTDRPPVDVDFSAVAGKVERRGRRLRRSAAGAAVLAVATIVAVTTSWGMSNGDRHSDASPPPPTSVPAAGGSAASIDKSWGHGSWNALSWRMPPGWLSTDLFSVREGSMSRPLGASSDGPVLSTVKLRCTAKTCGDLSDVVDKLPSDAVVGALVESAGLGGMVQPTIPEDAGSVTAPDKTCQGWGGAATFTSVRNFGTAPYTHSVSLSACLGSARVATAPAQLRALVASEKDASAVTVDSSWQQVAAGRMSWRMPGDWSTDIAPGSAKVVVDTSCLKAHAQAAGDYSCTPTFPRIAADGAYLWVSAVAAPSSPLAKVKYFGSMPATGACARAGGAYLEYFNQQHLGPQNGGQVLTMGGCVASDLSGAATIQVELMIARIADSAYGDPATLCSSVPGIVISSELETVGAVRQLIWGNTSPGATVFPKASATDEAAWCWVRDDAAQQYVVWVAHDGDTAQRLVSLTTAAYGQGFTPSGAPHSPPPASLAPAAGVHHDAEADALCAAVPGAVSGWLTTVGAVRSTTWGATAAAPLAHVFPVADVSDPAAWCWKGDNGTYTDYVVHAADAPVVAVSIHGLPAGVVPAGPPLFP